MQHSTVWEKFLGKILESWSCNAKPPLFLFARVRIFELTYLVYILSQRFLLRSFKSRKSFESWRNVMSYKLYRSALDEDFVRNEFEESFFQMINEVLLLSASCCDLRFWLFCYQNGETVLHYAAKHGKNHIFKLLLEKYRLDLSVQDNVINKQTSISLWLLWFIERRHTVASCNRWGKHREF